MACCDKHIMVDTIGLDFIITILENCEDIIDISTATSIDIYLTKPDGTLISKTGTLVTDGTDGKVKYTTVSGDLDQVGTWKIQAIINISSNVYPSSIYTFKVYANLV